MKSDSSLPGKQTPGSKPLYIREKSAEKTTEAAGQQCSGSSDRGSYGVIPHNDMAWVLKQKPSVITLFLECWLADSYGSRWMQLNTRLKDRAFRSAKKALSERGLFAFKPESSILDGRSNVCWLVKNLHGVRVDKGRGEDGADMPLDGTNMPTKGADMPLNGTNIPLNGTYMPPISPQTLTQSGVQERSLSSQYYFNIFSVSLSIAERENFENFVREEWKKKTTKPGQLGEEIISLERFLAKEEDCRNWYALFLASPAGKEAKKQAIAAQYNWENDPRFEEWLNRAFYDGYAWAQENEAEREQRIAFLEWAQATDPYQGRLY